MKLHAGTLLRSALLTLVLVLFGCAVTQGQADLARSAFVSATVLAIQKEKDPVERIERAKRIADIATEAQQFLSLESGSVIDLDALVRARLGYDKLDVGDRLLADELLYLAIGDIDRSIDAGLIPADQRYQLNAVLGWIIDTARVFQ